MQLSNFQKCAASPAPHPPAQPVSEHNEGTSELRRGSGRRSGKKQQNLKNISNHIRCLIGQNPQLTIPQLCFLLYEMIGKTQLGGEIISSGYAIHSQDIFEQLRLKYQEGEVQDERIRMIVKNVRRRLYDSLNVMISARVLRKVSKNRLEIIDRRANAEVPSSDRLEDELVTRLKKDLELRKADISNKKSVKDFLKQKSDLVRKLADRNSPHFFNIDKATLLYLPIVLADFPENTTIHLLHDQLSIESPSKVAFYSDIDCLQILFEEKPTEIIIKREAELD